MNESEMSKATTAELRLGAAQYFYTQYLKHCGPPLDSYFLMVNYFDAFLFALTSIEEMIDQHSKKALRANQTFRFLKALRNITTHHSVLAAAVGNAKFPRPFSRDLSVTIGAGPTDSSRLRLRFDILRNIFDAIEAERQKEKQTLDHAREFLAHLESKNSGNVYLEDIMKEGLEHVREIIHRCDHSDRAPV